MISLAGSPAVGIERISPSLPEPQLREVAQQCSRVMQWVQTDFYGRALGLTRIDTDPVPDPNDQQDVEWRMGRIRASGPVETTGLEFLRAVRLDADGNPRRDVDAMVGMLVLKKEGLCTSERHTPTKILEIDVHETMRHRGIGSAMLRLGVQGVHDEDLMLLDVARPNLRAQEWYRKLGFKPGGGRPRRLGVFDVDHLSMRARAGHLRQRLAAH